MQNPSVTVSTRYQYLVQEPCLDPDFEKHVRQTTRLFCEFEHESSITVTAITWSRKLPGGTIETFYSNGEFYADKNFLDGATHLNTETVVTATRFLISCPVKYRNSYAYSFVLFFVRLRRAENASTFLKVGGFAPPLWKDFCGRPFCIARIFFKEVAETHTQLIGMS